MNTTSVMPQSNSSFSKQSPPTKKFPNADDYGTGSSAEESSEDEKMLKGEQYFTGQEIGMCRSPEKAGFQSKGV
jgi:hypothetical protein